MTHKINAVELSTGVTLRYMERGDPSGIPILFLPGLSDSWLSFELLLSYLPESIRAFALTQRGHGNSSQPEEGYRCHDFAADAAAFMDAFHLETAVVVGHSLGGTIAQRFAINYPDRTSGLVLISPFHNLAGSPAAQELWPVVSTLEDPVNPEFVRGFQESTTAGPVPEAFMETIVQESMKLPAHVWIEVVRCMMQDDFSKELNKIKAPALLVWGDQDGMVPRSDQDRLLAAITDSRLVVYEDCGHAPHWEAPGRMASDIVNFTDNI